VPSSQFAPSLPGLGQMVWSERHRWWEHPEFPLPLFDGALVELYVVVSRTALEPAPAPPLCLAAVRSFLSLTSSALAEITSHVEQRRAASLGANAIMSGPVWNEVSPLSVTVEALGDVAYVVVECDCAWDMDAGLQLVLADGRRWVRVSSFDGCFTDGEAAGDPRLDAWMADPHAVLPLRPSRA
jgi:hypothetical protein